MPIYDYICSNCGKLTEVVHGINDGGPKFCPECGAEGTMTKAFAAPAIHFKGSGWAKKDRGSAARKAASASETAPAATGGEGGSSDGRSSADGAASGTTAKSSTEKPSAEKSSSSSSGSAATVKDRD